MPPVEVDARGLRCPWPALRLARAMRDMPAGGSVAIVADDPAAPREIAALAAEHGWELCGGGQGRWIVRRPQTPSHP